MTAKNQNTIATVLVLLMVDSMHLVFARGLRDHFSPIMASFLVLAIATVQIALYMGIRRQIQWHILRQHVWFFATIGISVGGATILSYAAVLYVDPGSASLLSRVVTIFSLGFGFFWLKERLTPRQWLGAFICLTGVAIISFQASNYWRLGSLFVIGSTFLYAFHTAVVKRYGDDIEFSNFFFFRVGATAVSLLFFVIGTGEFTVTASPTGWGIVFLTATIDVVVSRVLYYLVLRRLTLSLHAIILTVSPVVTIFWAFLFFREVPTERSLFGGAIVLLGILIVTLKPRLPRPPLARQ